MAKFYIGDMCHILPYKVLDEFNSTDRTVVEDRVGVQWVYYEHDGECGCVDDWSDFPQGYENDYDGELMFSLVDTYNGDGLFYDKDGNTYGVDMGMMGVVLITPEIEQRCKEREAQGLGKVFNEDHFDDTTAFGDPPTSWCNLPKLYRNGKGCFIFGDKVIIPTGLN